MALQIIRRNSLATTCFINKNYCIVINKPRTLFVKNSFPKRTQKFVKFQEKQRLIDSIPNGSELVYLLPPYKTMYINLMDRVSIIVTVAAICGCGVFICRSYLMESEEEVDHNGQKCVNTPEELLEFRSAFPLATF
jgi:hypothetical protein